MIFTEQHSNYQPFPIDLPGFTTIGKAWPAFRHDSSRDSGELTNLETQSCENISNAQSASSNAVVDMSNWKWPKAPVIFISDPHADAQAFFASLVASGGIKRSAKGKLSLTQMGKKSIFIIGGDCLDKGPSNLDLLDAVKTLIKTGAKVKLLAGNHDLRLLTGLHCLSSKAHVGSEHMFVRMGTKVIPLFKEVFERFLENTKWQKNVPSVDRCREHLFPRDSWFEEFPIFAKQKLSSEAIDKEIKRLRGKVDSFEQNCLKAGLSLQMVYAAAKFCEKSFLKPKGKYAWFFNKMQLAHREGCFLFVHAGLDDEISEEINKKGVVYLNKQFKKLVRKDLFNFYFSAISSTFRTKYRDSDPRFSKKGVEAIRRCGIEAIVHGHVNHANGQQVSLQEGLLHIEADITLDRNSRQKEGLNGIGFGATIIYPKQMVVGISADYPFAKVLSPHTASFQNNLGLLNAS